MAEEPKNAQTTGIAELTENFRDNAKVINIRQLFRNIFDLLTVIVRQLFVFYEEDLLSVLWFFYYTTGFIGRKEEIKKIDKIRKV